QARAEDVPLEQTPSSLLRLLHYKYYKAPLYASRTISPTTTMDGSSAQSIYRAEKARAMQERRMSHAQLMAEAKEAFAKMLADAQLARKGGRPRTNPITPAAAAAAAKARAAAQAAPAKPPTPRKSK